MRSPQIKLEFASFADYIAACEDDSKPRWLNDSRELDFGFCGTNSYQEALDLANYGWRQGLEQVIAGAANAPLQAMGRAPAWEYGVAGYLPCVPAYAAGDPCHMMTRGNAFAGGRPIVKILVNVCFSSYIDVDHIINRGAALMGIIDYLESQDMRVEINASCRCNGSKGSYFDVTFPVKAANEPLERDKVIFGIGHPSILRRLFFHLSEQISELEQPLGPTCGRPANATEIPEDTVYLEKYNRGCEDMNAATGYVLSRFEKVLTAQQIEQIQGICGHDL